MSRSKPESASSWKRIVGASSSGTAGSPKRARRVLTDEDERFLRDIEKTHLANDPSVEDLFGETQDLEPICEKASLREYLKDLWPRRHFIWRESNNKVLNQPSTTVLGPVRLVLVPPLLAAFCSALFGIVLGVSPGMPHFVAFIIIAISTPRSSTGTIGPSTKAT